MGVPGRRRFPKIIDDLYAGTLDAAAWERALIATADLVSGTDALLFGFNPSTGQVLRDEAHRFDPVAIADYRRHWAEKDFRFGLFAKMPIGEPIFEAKLLPLSELKRSEFYNEFLVPVDATSFLLTWLHKDSQKLVCLTIQGSKRREPFDERDAQRIRQLIPHVRRALEIKDRLEVSQIRSDTLAKSLDA